MGNALALLRQASQREAEVEILLSCNKTTSKHGLTLSKEQATDLLAHRNKTLANVRRVEFGTGVLPEIIKAFADCSFLSQETYAETICNLQEAFYHLKEETEENIPDTDLIDGMRILFDTKAQGNLDYFFEMPGQEIEKIATHLKHDVNADWSEYDAYEKEDEREENSEYSKQSEDRIQESDEHIRPDNEYASSFYEAYNELYRIGFDYNSRIGGSSL